MAFLSQLKRPAVQEWLPVADAVDRASVAAYEAAAKMMGLSIMVSYPAPPPVMTPGFDQDAAAKGHKGIYISVSQANQRAALISQCQELSGTEPSHCS